MADNRPTTRTLSSTRLRDVIVPMVRKSGLRQASGSLQKRSDRGGEEREKGDAEREFPGVLFLAKDCLQASGRSFNSHRLTLMGERSHTIDITVAFRSLHFQQKHSFEFINLLSVD